jgi:hypothetical protein
LIRTATITGWPVRAMLQRLSIIRIPNRNILLNRLDLILELLLIPVSGCQARVHSRRSRDWSNPLQNAMDVIWRRIMRTRHRNVVTALVALLIGVSFAPALAAGSDVAHYPKPEVYKDASVREPCEIGVPTPRTRTFDHARWADEPTRPHF